MKKQKVNLSQLNQMKQQFQNLAKDTDLVTMRVNGRSYQFNENGKIVVVEELSKIDFNLETFNNDVLILNNRICRCLNSNKNSLNQCIDDTCFMCRYFKHLDPDTDVCNITGEERYFDSPKCEDFEICMGEDNAEK